MKPWHVGVAAEAFAAAQFARYTYDVSVQYGANQPEYDLIAVSGDKMLKISVKGSQDGSWGLTQSFKKGRNYHEAVQEWLNRHYKKQFSVWFSLKMWMILKCRECILHLQRK